MIRQVGVVLLAFAVWAPAAVAFDGAPYPRQDIQFIGEISGRSLQERLAAFDGIIETYERIGDVVFGWPSRTRRDTYSLAFSAPTPDQHSGAIFYGRCLSHNDVCDVSVQRPDCALTVRLKRDLLVSPDFLERALRRVNHIKCGETE